VASNTPTWLWGVRALACLSGEASDYLHQQLLEADLSYEQVVGNPQLLPWSKLDQLMSSGNFGSAPTDNSVRDKLCSFQLHSPLYPSHLHPPQLLTFQKSTYNLPVPTDAGRHMHLKLVLQGETVRCLSQNVRQLSHRVYETKEPCPSHCLFIMITTQQNFSLYVILPFSFCR
jgi:hypothetical protein